MSDTDCIVRSVVVNAPIERVWSFVGRAGEFGRWFGVAFDGEFEPGARISGRITPTEADPEIAKLQEPHAGTPFDVVVETVDPPHRLAFHWHPHAIGGADYAHEPTTLVTFDLESVADGTKLTITESGFDRIPLERRAAAFDANGAGWSMQATLVAKYVARQVGAAW
jgi:uncharacterized protein YndB with AHSA1/START domain